MTTKTKAAIAAVGTMAALAAATISAPIDDVKKHDEAKLYYKQQIENSGKINIMDMFGKDKKVFIQTLDDEVKNRGGATLKGFSSDKTESALGELLK